MMNTTDHTGHNSSFLAAEENYLYVREMQRKNLIVPLVGDFAGPAAIRNVARYLKERNPDIKIVVAHRTDGSGTTASGRPS